MFLFTYFVTFPHPNWLTSSNTLSKCLKIYSNSIKFYLYNAFNERYCHKSAFHISGFRSSFQVSGDNDKGKKNNPWDSMRKKLEQKRRFKRRTILRSPLLDSEILINQIMKRQKHWTHWKYVRSILWIGVLRWTYIIWAYCE